MATNRIPTSETARNFYKFDDVQRNALAPAWEASQALTGESGMEARFVLDLWSRRPTIDMTPDQVAEFRAMLDEARADECRRLFDEAVQA